LVGIEISEHFTAFSEVVDQHSTLVDQSGNQNAVGGRAATKAQSM
jgi:hypothetical protein